jgi:hypothetical protein
MLTGHMNIAKEPLKGILGKDGAGSCGVINDVYCSNYLPTALHRFIVKRFGGTDLGF